MRNDLVLDLADCTEFRQALQARPPGIVHGTLVLLVGPARDGARPGRPRRRRTSSSGHGPRPPGDHAREGLQRRPRRGPQRQRRRPRRRGQLPRRRPGQAGRRPDPAGDRAAGQRDRPAGPAIRAGEEELAQAGSARRGCRRASSRRPGPRPRRSWPRRATAVRPGRGAAGRRDPAGPAGPVGRGAGGRDRSGGWWSGGPPPRPSWSRPR